VRLRSRLFGDYMVSLPFVNYGGVIADSEEIAHALVREAILTGERLGVSHIEFRQAGDELDLPAKSNKVAMLLELPESAEALGKSIGAKRRSQVRRPLRENPETRIGGTELLDDFYDVFSRNMRDLGTPVYAKSMFADLLQRFSGQATIVTIRVDDTPAAAAFLLRSGTRMEIPWASTARQFNRISINMLLYWEVLSHAIDTGIRTFDFGRSSADSGTYKFKKQWGAEPQQLHWHYWLADPGEMPELNPDNTKFSLAIRAWQKLPLPVANLLGPQIVKHLP
jgi:FemAB-related protein (PEP-CTERM system-associated)